MDAKESDLSNTTMPAAPSAPIPFLVIDEKPIYFQEDWHQGIGGGLWSTGSALARFFGTSHAKQFLHWMVQRKEQKQQQNNQHEPRKQQQQQQNQDNKNNSQLSVLELGSGNGLLAICLIALAAAAAAKENCGGDKIQQDRSDNKDEKDDDDDKDKIIPSNSLISDFVITDTNEHLELIEKTIDANTHLFSYASSSWSSSPPPPSGIAALQQQPRVHVIEHQWGEFRTSVTTTTTTTNSKARNERNSKAENWIESMKEGRCTFDLIIASDVVYRKELYDPFIASLTQFSKCGPDGTSTLLGVTMADTTPSFFHKLRDAGFTYRRFADHLLEPEFRGATFGIFLVQKQ